jgi:hypothetical protein
MRAHRRTSEADLAGRRPAGVLRRSRPCLPCNAAHQCARTVLVVDCVVSASLTGEQLGGRSMAATARAAASALPKARFSPPARAAQSDSESHPTNEHFDLLQSQPKITNFCHPVEHYSSKSYGSRMIRYAAHPSGSSPNCPLAAGPKLQVRIASVGLRCCIFDRHGPCFRYVKKPHHPPPPPGA